MERKFEKLRMPWDYVQENPLISIKEVYENISLDYMLFELTYWLFMAVSNPSTIYDIPNDRINLVEFVYDLRYFLQALCKYGSLEGKYELSHYNVAEELSNEELENPFPLIMQFYETYSMPYLRNELLHFLESVTSYRGKFEEHVDQIGFINLYANLLCLLDGGYLIFKTKKDVSLSQAS